MKENTPEKDVTQLRSDRSRARMRKAMFFALAASMFSVLINVSRYPGVAQAFHPLLLFVLPVLPGAWFGVAALVVLILIAVAALVYLASSFLDSPNARGWAKVQIYEGIFTIVLLLLFLGSLSLFFLNPEPALQSINLVPNIGPPFGCTTATDMYQLATCNLASFNLLTFSMFATLYYATQYAAFAPGFSLSYSKQFATNVEISAGASLTSILPFSAETSFPIGYSALLTLLMLNQVLVILAASSLFWFVFFITLGLIARAFGFTRSFGGAMIALGFGLGFVYPLLINITYGYINFQLNNPPVNGQTLATEIYGSIFVLALGQGGAISGQWVFQLGAMIAGLTFIPFLNFTVVDAFIIDFSKAMGEQLNFMSLLVGVI